MNSWLHDLRYACRTLLRNPGFTAVVLLTLALGIGVNTAVYSLMRGTLFGRLPFADADRLAIVVSIFEERVWSVSIPEMRDVAERCDLLEDVAIFETRRSPVLTGGEQPERPRTNFVTPAYFRTLRAQAAHGRTFLAEEDEGAGGHPVAIISHELWQRRFGGDPALVGSKILLSEEPFTVVGIMPPGFQDIRRDLTDRSDLWLPMSMGVPFFGEEMFESRVNRQYLGLARLKEGVSFAEAQAQLDVLAKQLEKEYPYPHEKRGLRLIPPREWYYGDLRPIIKTLAAGAVLVLLICCTNLALLLLLRGRTRQQEIAVCVALGAGRGLLLRRTLTESLLLAFAGGGLGILLAWLTVRFWVSAFGLPGFADVGIDRGVLFASLGLTLVTGLVLGLFPAFRLSRVSLRTALQSSGRQMGSVERARRGPSPIVVAQVAVAVVLFVGSALTAKSLYQITQADLGIDTANLLTLQLELRGRRYETDDAVKSFVPAIVERLQAVPGVRSAVVWGPSMLTSPTGLIRMSSADMDPTDPNGRLMAQRLHVNPGGLEDLGIPLLRGREFTPAEKQSEWPLYAVVGERLAKALWPGQDAVGQRFYTGEDPTHVGFVIGVARDIKHRGAMGSEDAVAGDVYVSYLQRPLRNLTLLVRYQGDVGAVLGGVRRVVGEMDPNLVLDKVETLDDYITRTEAGPRVIAALMALYASIALLLVALGVYGVLAYSVQQRAPELAMRSALGAQPRRQLLMVIRQGLASVVLGVVLGLASAYALSRFIESLLFGVSRTDPSMYLAVTVLLILVALAACYLPARRASRVDPMLVLRGG